MNWKPAISKIAIKKIAVSKTSKIFMLALPQNTLLMWRAFFQFLLKYQVDTPQQSVVCSKVYSENSKL